jgi:outer membrane protein, heavy metal efflux system
LHKPVIACLSASALLAGCVSYSPRPLDPSAELAALNARALPFDRFVRTVPATDSASDNTRFDASDGLNDRELMALAVSMYPDLQVARAALGETEALLIGAKTLPNPEFGVGFGAGILGNPGFKLDTDLLFELLRPGERDARVGVAAATIAASRADILVREYEVAAGVRRTTFEVLVVEQVAAIFDEEAGLRSRAVEIVRRRRDIGEANELDIAVAELELMEIQRDRRLAKVELDQARLALNRAVGLPPEFSLPLEQSGKSIDIPLIEGAADARVDELILARRLDLKARAATYEIAEQRLRLAISKQYPKIKIGPSYSHEGVSDNYLGIGASIEVPIFDRNQGEIAEKAAARDRVRAEYVAALHRLQSEAKAALARVQALRAEIDDQRQHLLPLLARSQTLFGGALEARELSVTDWVSTQQRALRARRAYIDTLVAYRRALLDYEAATGEPIAILAPDEPVSAPPTITPERSTP